MTEDAKPITAIELSKLTTESLVMMFNFIPKYCGEDCEHLLVAGVKEELLRRSVIKVHPEGTEWRLDQDTREELRDVWEVDEMLERFLQICDDRNYEKS